MKKLVSTFLIVTTLVFFVPVEKAYAVSPTDYISCWDLEETGGTRVDAETTNSNDLTDNNTVLYGTGILGNGADFELATAETLSITDGTQTGLDFTNDYSTSFWVKYESIPPAQDQSMGLYSKYVKDTAGYEAFLGHYPTNTYQVIALYSAGTANYRQWNITTPTTGVWYHYAIVTVSSATASDSKFYIDGVDQGAPDASGGTATTITDGAGTFEIGNNPRWNGYASETTYDGLMDVFEVYNRTLTSDEVTALYNAGAGVACTGRNAGGGDTSVFDNIIYY